MLTVSTNHPWVYVPVEIQYINPAGVFSLVLGVRWRWVVGNTLPLPCTMDSWYFKWLTPPLKWLTPPLLHPNPQPFFKYITHSLPHNRNWIYNLCAKKMTRTHLFSVLYVYSMCISVDTYCMHKNWITLLWVSVLYILFYPSLLILDTFYLQKNLFYPSGRGGDGFCVLGLVTG